MEKAFGLHLHLTKKDEHLELWPSRVVLGGCDRTLDVEDDFLEWWAMAIQSTPGASCDGT
jgi:hypothetical protein